MLEQKQHLTEPFEICVSDAVLDDLTVRLKATRWIDAQPGWKFGIDDAFMHEIVDHWLHAYNWRTHEARLNARKQYRATVSDVAIHFVYERGKGQNPAPLLLLHGFPDSFYRYHRVIERLIDPAKFGGDPSTSFDVIVPSIPGTGFSDRVALDRNANANLFVALMSDVLNYDTFFAAGGDQGAMIVRAMLQQHPEHLRGVHLTDVGYPDGKTDFSTLSPAELEMAQWVQRWFMEEGLGVNAIMATKPQTLAYALNDSPAGLAAWLLSYPSSGEKGRDEFKQRFSLDELITNVMIYWVTGTICSAAKAYFVNAALGSEPPTTVSSVPACVAHCPYDPPLPREWAARHVNLVRFTEYPRGGHFMAWEEPELYAADVAAFAAYCKRLT
jgi:pimeloyl-ACP methyl ester carboxylesterase